MTDYVEKKIFRLKLLTAVHISDGYEGELLPTEYVVTNNGVLHKLDLPRLIIRIPEDRMVLFNEHLENEDIIGIRNFMKSLWQEKQDIFSDSIEYSMRAGDLHDYYNNLENENDASQLTVTPFIRTARRTFIPGSSLKGAIRTAFISELLGKEGIDYKLNKPKLDKAAQMLEAKTLNYRYKDHKRNRFKILAGKDPFKALKTSDVCLPAGKSIIKKIQVVRKMRAGQFDVTGMEKMNIFAEIIEKGVETDIEVSLDSRYFEFPRKVGKRFSFKDIMAGCKSFYERVLAHEKKAFFNEFDKNIEGSRVSGLYDEFQKLNAKPNSFLLRLGKHSGRNSLSFNLYNKKGVEPKSRKLIVQNGEYWPMGWVSLTEL